jgi:hypothetical protein
MKKTKRTSNGVKKSNSMLSAMHCSECMLRYFPLSSPSLSYNEALLLLDFEGCSMANIYN